jgi:carbon-monoxide dehydrogenase medium subunit
MKSCAFAYTAPASLDEAVAALARHGGEAKVLAGGQSLVPLLATRLARPSALVDLARVPGLDGVCEADGALAIGAMARKRDVERSPLVRRRQPLLHAATLLVGHAPIRNRGTVGGSLAQADPAAEYPAVALALDATLRAVGPDGARELAAADFFLGPLTTALDPLEVLVESRWPALPPRTGWGLHEVSRRPGDFALAGAVATVRLDAGGRAAAVRLVLFGVGATPLRAREAEGALAGAAAGDAAALARAADAAAAAVAEPLSDLHASADYRRHLARVCATRALGEAAARAREAAHA